MTYLVPREVAMEARRRALCNLCIRSFFYFPRGTLLLATMDPERMSRRAKRLENSRCRMLLFPDPAPGT